MNALHPQAKTRFAMRVLDARVGLRNPWARRLEQYYGQPVPSALLLGLEPAPAVSCASCPASGGCPREGSDYRDLARAVAEARRLGVRLFVAAGSGVVAAGSGVVAAGSGVVAAGSGVVEPSGGRYWPELLDLALRNPACTFLVLAGRWAAAEEIAAGAAAAGNLGFVFPQGQAAEPASRAAGPELDLPPGLGALRAAGVPFGFAARLAPERVGGAAWESWVEGMLDQGYLFGLFYPLLHTSAAQAGPRTGREIAPSGRGAALPGKGSPMPLFDLREEVSFTDEAGARVLLRGDGQPGDRERRGGGSRSARTLLVHAVTPRSRSLTLLESIEAVVPGAGPDHVPVCPLLLGRGSSREVLYGLLSE